MYTKHALQGISAIVLTAAIVAAFFISPFNAGAANTYSAQLDAASSQYFSVPDSSSLSTTGDITVEAWIKPTSMVDGVSQYIAAKGTTGSYNAWRLVAQWNATDSKHNLVFAIDETGSNSVAVAYSYADIDLGSYVGTWVHVAATWNASSGTAAPKLYVNGAEVASYFTQGNDGGTNAIADTDSPTYIGNSPNETLYFDGKIDDVRIWNIERTASAILNNYNQEIAGNESGLVAYWKLNNDSGIDSTSNTNNLTQVNGIMYTTDIPDMTPPTVTLTSPLNGSTVSGTISLVASSTDNMSVAGVQFKVDGNNFGAEDTSSPYSISLDTTTLTNAVHTISAVARDTSNNTATSGSVSVTVSNAAPFVEILRVRKSVTESLATSTTLQNDDALKLQLKGSKTYIIDGVILASAGNGTPDIKLSLSGAGISTSTLGYVSATEEGVIWGGATSPKIDLTSTQIGLHISGTVVTSADGDFQLKWAQNTSNANITSVLAGSYLRAEEI